VRENTRRANAVGGHSRSVGRGVRVIERKRGAGWRDRDLYTLLKSADALAPPDEGPRYVFLEEITGMIGDWVARIKWLRDNTSLGDSCTTGYIQITAHGRKER
jgi:hypothetical protein